MAVCYRPVIELPLTALAPGEFLIEIVARSEGQQPVSDVIAFRVGS